MNVLFRFVRILLVIATFVSGYLWYEAEAGSIQRDILTKTTLMFIVAFAAVPLFEDFVRRWNP